MLIHEWKEPFCLYCVSIHQMAPLPTEVADIWLQLTTHLSTPERMNGLVSLVNGWWTCSGRFCPHKWSPISCRSSAGQGKFAGESQAFHHCAMQPSSRPFHAVIAVLLAGTWINGRSLVPAQNSSVDSFYCNGITSVTRDPASCQLVCHKSLMGLFSSQETSGISLDIYSIKF